MGLPRIKERDQALYRILVEAAGAGMATPRQSDLIRTMAACGHKITKDIVGNIVLKLKQCSMIDVLGAGDGTGANRYYVIMDSGLKTVPRAKAALMAEAEWSPFGLYSCAAYDAAVANREFAKHELRRPPDGPRVHKPAASAFQIRSYTGCSAAMAA